MLMSEGQSFSVKEHHRTVATGIITGVLDDIILNSTQLGRNEISL